MANDTINNVFMEDVITCRLAAYQVTPVAAGLRNAWAEAADDTNPVKQETPTAMLNWWQAANVRSICDFLSKPQQDSEGLVMCDAPGLGKTLSVMAAIRCSMKDDNKLAVIFAGKGIVAQ